MTYVPAKVSYLVEHRIISQKPVENVKMTMDNWHVWWLIYNRSAEARQDCRSDNWQLTYLMTYVQDKALYLVEHGAVPQKPVETVSLTIGSWHVWRLIYRPRRYTWQTTVPFRRTHRDCWSDNWQLTCLSIFVSAKASYLLEHGTVPEKPVETVWVTIDSWHVWRFMYQSRRRTC